MSTTGAEQGRRRFLAALGAGGVAATVAVATGRTQRERQIAARSERLAQERGYRLTEHIREYYRTARV